MTPKLSRRLARKLNEYANALTEENFTSGMDLVMSCKKWVLVNDPNSFSEFPDKFKPIISP